MQESPIRVAMIGQKGYPPIHGGIEKHVAELAKRLGPSGFELDIYSRPHYSQSSGSTDIPGVSVTRLPSIPTKHLDAISHSALSTIHAVFRNYDIVHYHALGPGLLANIPRIFGGKKTVVTVHGLDWQRDKWGTLARRILKIGEATCVQFPTRTIVVSKALRKHFLDEYQKATVYIPNGIEPPVYRNPDKIREIGVDRKYVLFVGRLVPEKGCHLLLEAWQTLPLAIRQEYQLVIAGDAGFTPGYVESLRKMATPGVIFTGYVHGQILEELFTNTELMVLPSTLEGLSITLLEGMSYARCCLISDIPPNLEAGGKDAVYFSSGNMAELSAKLAEILPQDTLRQEIGARAQIHAIENYSWERVAAATAGLYREML